MVTSIEEKITQLRKEVPPRVKIIAVTKTRSTDEVMEAYRAGQIFFGENKAQEMIAKQPLLPSDIEWHFIGHLQTNKVRQILPFVSLIHSLDSIKLLRTIHKEALLLNRSVNCLLQFHIATEETKFGLDLTEGFELLQTMRNEKIENISIRGVMGMATFTHDEELIRQEFRNLVNYYSLVKKEFFEKEETFTELSFGMSGDYLLAIQEGSTMIRIGTAIFGERKYP